MTDAGCGIAGAFASSDENWHFMVRPLLDVVGGIRKRGFLETGHVELSFLPPDGSAFILRADFANSEVRVTPVQHAAGQHPFAPPARRGTLMSNADVILAALRLKRERVTADTAAAKQEKRDHLKSLIGKVYLRIDGFGSGPSAAELREALGDPDDRELRAALDAWDQPDA